MKRPRSDSHSQLAEKLSRWRDINAASSSCASNDGDTAPVLKKQRRAPAVGSKKGCMPGKGGPQNQCFNFRGVRQRVSGKWVAEIRQPNGGKKLWLGTFSTARDAASAYDDAAKAIFGSSARLNFPDSGSSTPAESTLTTASHSHQSSPSPTDSTLTTTSQMHFTPVVEPQMTSTTHAQLQGHPNRTAAHRCSYPIHPMLFISWAGCGITQLV